MKNPSLNAPRKLPPRSSELGLPPKATMLFPQHALSGVIPDMCLSVSWSPPGSFLQVRNFSDAVIYQFEQQSHPRETSMSTGGLGIHPLARRRPSSGTAAMGGRTGAHAMDAESTVTNRSSSVCRRPPREKRISDIHPGAGGVAVKAPSNIRSRYSRLDVEQPVQVCPLAGDKE